MLSCVCHKNIVAFKGCEVKGDNVEITMERCRYTLRELIERGHLFSEQFVWKVIRDLSDALRYLHMNDIMHRDISWNNVMFKKTGVAKLTDFGLCRVVLDKVYATSISFLL